MAAAAAPAASPPADEKSYPIPFCAAKGTEVPGMLTLFNAAAIMDYIQRECGGAEYSQTRASVAWPPSVAARHSGEANRGSDDDNDDNDTTGASSPTNKVVFLPRALQTDNFKREKRLVPGDRPWIKALSFTFPTPLGFKTITADGVVKWLKASGIPFITDMLPSAVDPVAMLKPYAYTDVDEMRFLLAALAQYAEKGWLDAEGKLTGLAKRDMKKNCKAGSSAGEEDNSSSTKKDNRAAAASPAAASKEHPVNKKNRPGKTPGVIKDAPKRTEQDRPQRNVKLLLDDHLKARYPYTPPAKSAVLTTEQDPNQPRHKPLYRSTVTLPAMKGKKIEGSWQPNRRDAENAVYESALTLLLTLPMGK